MKYANIILKLLAFIAICITVNAFAQNPNIENTLYVIASCQVNISFLKLFGVLK